MRWNWIAQYSPLFHRRASSLTAFAAGTVPRKSGAKNVRLHRLRKSNALRCSRSLLSVAHGNFPGSVGEPLAHCLRSSPEPLLAIARNDAGSLVGGEIKSRPAGGSQCFRSRCCRGLSAAAHSAKGGCERGFSRLVRLRGRENKHRDESSVVPSLSRTTPAGYVFSPLPVSGTTTSSSRPTTPRSRYASSAAGATAQVGST